MKNRKYIVAFSCTVVLTVLCTLLSYLSLPKSCTYMAPDEMTSVASEVGITADNAAISTDGTVTITGDDPQLLFSGISQPITTLYIQTENADTAELVGQLFYSRDGEPYSAGNSLLSYDMDGDGGLYFQLETGVYDSLRLDIDCNYRLTDVRVSQQAPVQTLPPVLDAINWFQVVFIFLVMLIQTMFAAWKWDVIVLSVRTARTCVAENKKQLLIQVGFMAAFAALAMIGWGGLCLLHILSWSGYTAFYFLMGGCAVGALFGLWYRKGTHPERTFLVLTLCIGLVYLALAPRTTYITLDDESHYAAALRLSYFGETYYTQSDLSLMQMHYPPALGNELAEDTVHQLNEGYRAGVIYQDHGGYLKYTRLSYLPAAAFMWMARVLHCPFTAIFTAGRLGNLLCYALVMYFAYRRLKQGGLLLGVFALLPMMISSAASYSYDGFCLSFLALGTAVFLDEYRHPERPLTWWAGGEILLFLALGCSVRAVFFPIFLMCLFMPKEKFDTPRKKNAYRLFVILVTLLVLLSFVLPMLFVNGSYNDTRGGSDVNSGLQVAGILANPFGYLVLLLRFLFTQYFTVDFMVTYAVNFQGYLPTADFGLAFVALLAVAYLYKPGRRDLTVRRTAPGVKIAAAVSFFCSVCLAATAMYVAFTPVGLDTVNGCQARYMMPVLLPMLLQLQPQQGWEPDHSKPDYFSTAMLAVVAALVFYGQLAWAKGYAGL